MHKIKDTHLGVAKFDTNVRDPTHCAELVILAQFESNSAFTMTSTRKRLKEEHPQLMFMTNSTHERLADIHRKFR